MMQRTIPSLLLLSTLVACEDEKLEDVTDSGVETVDSDGDGVVDSEDAFPDDASESVDSDGDGVGDNADAFPDDAAESVDTDADGVGDNADDFPTDPNETTDSDADGVGDNQEAGLGTDPNNADSDGDGLSDGEEVAAGTNPNSSDTDNDGLSDAEEMAAGTNPTNGDSDGDGALDGEEVADGTDPNDPTSGGADPILPDGGFWKFNQANVSSDQCNLSFILGLAQMSIMDILPPGFDVTPGSTNSFTGSMLSQSLTCSVAGANFNCGTVTTTQNFDMASTGFGSGIIAVGMELALTGSMTDTQNMSMILDLDVTSCTGADCTTLRTFVPYPCGLRVLGTASLQ